jgi:hypothetical protein
LVTGFTGITNVCETKLRRENEMLKSLNTLKCRAIDEMLFLETGLYPKYKIRHCKIFWIFKKYDDGKGNESVEIIINKHIIPKWEFEEIKKTRSGKK